jgi:hypothetical protein
MYRLQEDSAKLTDQQKSDPEFIIQRPSETPGHSLVSNINNDAFKSGV